jgi:hypothetical protein
MTYGKAQSARGKGYGAGAWPKPRAGQPLTRRYSYTERDSTVGGAPEESGPYVVQGQTASSLEWRVYQALRKLGWTDELINFQADFMGGHLPGGQVLDFVVYVPGQRVVISVDGDYWHNYTQAQIERDRQKSAAISAVWTRPYTFIKLNTGDLLSDDQAYYRLLREVGRGF